MDDSAILSTQGLLLTLVSLLGTFFYIHLSEWRRDLIKLKAKWDQNEFGETPEEKTVLLQVRYELPGLGSWVTPVVTGIVTWFILMVAALSIALWTQFSGPNGIRMALMFAGAAFLVLYIGLTCVFLLGGLRTASELDKAIQEKYPPPEDSD